MNERLLLSADGRFGLEQVQFIHIERLNGFSSLAWLNDRAQLLVRASGQLTQNPLLSLEKFTPVESTPCRVSPKTLRARQRCRRHSRVAITRARLPPAGPPPRPRDRAFAGLGALVGPSQQ